MSIFKNKNSDDKASENDKTQEADRDVKKRPVDPHDTGGCCGSCGGTQEENS